jgi:pilus assembly protein CpaF
MRSNSLNDLVLLGSLTDEMAQTLLYGVEHGLNILVSGGTQAGKTTLLNSLMSAIPVGERIISIEEVFELKPNLPDWIALQTRTANLEGEGEISLRKLIKEALRMRPSRLIVGEVREAEALDLLIAFNSGLPGMATIHANSAKLQLLPLLAGENITQAFINPTISSSIDLIVQCIMDRSGNRRITEIAAVTGRVEINQVEVDSLHYWDGSNHIRGLSSIENLLKMKKYMVSPT